VAAAGFESFACTKLNGQQSVVCKNLWHYCLPIMDRFRAFSAYAPNLLKKVPKPAYSHTINIRGCATTMPYSAHLAFSASKDFC
jgi:hypothetical protein